MPSREKEDQLVLVVLAKTSCWTHQASCTRLVIRIDWLCGFADHPAASSAGACIDASGVTVSTAGTQSELASAVNASGRSATAWTLQGAVWTLMSASKQQGGNAMPYRRRRNGEGLSACTR